MFENPRELCEHIKKHHFGVKKYKCANPTCRSSFTELYTYRRHLDLCCSSVSNSCNAQVSTYDEQIGNDLKAFDTKMDDVALRFVCKLASNMSVPRNHTFEVITDIQQFLITTMIDGINQHIKPHVSQHHQSSVDFFIEICKDPFRNVRSEFKLDSVLEKEDLIEPLTTFDVNKKKNKNESDEELEVGGKGILMPLVFQFKKFFELPDVFEITQKYAEELSKHENISHFINAEVWKEKLKSYGPNETVIPFHFHIDDTQINNALGSHCSVGMETCTYYSFPTIPPQFSSRLENIFTAQLISSDAFKKCGNVPCFCELVEAINEISHTPIHLNINGKEIKVTILMSIKLLGE